MSTEIGVWLHHRPISWCLLTRVWWISCSHLPDNRCTLKPLSAAHNTLWIQCTVQRSYSVQCTAVERSLQRPSVSRWSRHCFAPPPPPPPSPPPFPPPSPPPPPPPPSGGECKINICQLESLIKHILSAQIFLIGEEVETIRFYDFRWKLGDLYQMSNFQMSNFQMTLFQMSHFQMSTQCGHQENGT